MQVRSTRTERVPAASGGSPHGAEPQGTPTCRLVSAQAPTAAGAALEQPLSDHLAWLCTKKMLLRGSQIHQERWVTFVVRPQGHSLCSEGG